VLAQHSEALLHCSPDTLHTGGVVQRPAEQVSPEQHAAPVPHDAPLPPHGCTQRPEAFRTSPAQQSLADRAAIPDAAQNEAQLITEVPLPMQYGAPEQHAIELEAHELPTPMQVGALVQRPPLHDSPEQQGDVVEHAWPLDRHTGALVQRPPLHDSPEQQGDVAEHAWPLDRQTGALAQNPPLQDNPEQHGDVAEQLWPLTRQVVPPPLVTQRAVVELHVSPEQQAPPNAPLHSSPAWEQLPEPVPRMHCPPEQRLPPQQSFEVEHD